MMILYKRIDRLKAPAQLKQNWNKTVKQIPIRVDDNDLVQPNQPSHNT